RHLDRHHVPTRRSSDLIFKPFCSYFIGLWSCSVMCFPAFDETESIPYFIGKVPSLLTIRYIKHQVIASRRGEQHSHTDTVGAVLLHELDRVWRAAQRFGHFPTQLVTNYARQIDVFGRRLLGIVVAHYDHTGCSEKQDVRGSDKVTGRIVVVEISVFVSSIAVKVR